MDDIQVTILVICYNQEKYIAEALESVLMQKTNFKYSITVMDDYSTDKTLAVVNDYKEKYPDLIDVLPSKKNLGVTKNYKRAFKSVKTKYAAIIEGDDYWTSSNKLQIQYDFLELHGECSFCCHKFLVKNQISYENNINKFSFPKNLHHSVGLYNTEKLINDNFIGNFSTCMYRKINIDQISDSLFEMEMYDWMYNIVQSQFGLIGYIDNIMSVYRQHNKGVWSSKISSMKIKSTIDVIDKYDEFLKYNFHNEFKNVKNRLKASISGFDRLNNINYEFIKNILLLCVPKIFKIIYKLFVPPIFSKIIKYMRNKI